MPQRYRTMLKISANMPNNNCYCKLLDQISWKNIKNCTYQISNLLQTKKRADPIFYAASAVCFYWVNIKRKSFLKFYSSTKKNKNEMRKSNLKNPSCIKSVCVHETHAIFCSSSVYLCELCIFTFMRNRILFFFI